MAPLSPRDALRMIEQAEEYVRSLGFGVFRVRYLAQPVLPRWQNSKLSRPRWTSYAAPEPQIRDALRAIGFRDLLVDPEGYQAPSVVRTAVASAAL